MKKFLIILLLVLPFISSVEFTLNEEINQGQTLFTKLSGNFLTSVTKENIYFYEGNISDSNFRVSLDYGLAKIEGEFYIYASTTGLPPGNYSIFVKNTQYMKGSQVSNEDIMKSFVITNETADFSVNPGVIVDSEGFYLSVQDLQDEKIEITVSTDTSADGRSIFISSPETSTESTFSVKSGEIKKIKFTLGEGDSTFQYISLSSGGTSYQVPVYIFSSSESETPEQHLDFEPSELISTFKTGELITKTVYLYNFGDFEITNISLSLSDSLNSFVDLSTDFIENLSNDSHYPIELSFSYDSEEKIEGELVAKSENFSTSLFISLNFSSNSTVINETENNSSSNNSGEIDTTKTCEELNGLVCDTDTEQCSTTIFYAKDGVCCLGTCKAKGEGTSSGRIIAAVLIFLVIILIVWFYFKKYKKAKKPVDLVQIGKGIKN